MTTELESPALSVSLGPLRGTAADEIGADGGDAMRAAAKAAGVHAFISELPEGYRTPIGDGGVVVPPSQRLRLAIARLLAADPPCVRLDDPTGHLGAAAEAAALPGLEALLRGRRVELAKVSPAVRAAAARAARGSGEEGRASADPLTALRPDPVLTGMPHLLDPHEMAPLLAGVLGESRVPDVRVTSVRYKPGDNVVVQYDVGTAGGWSTAVAYANGQSDLEAKSGRRRNSRLVRQLGDRVTAPRPLAYLPEVAALVQWLPLDVRLPILSEPGSRLAHRLLKHGLIDGGDSEPELLRYWARRRAVLRLGEHVLKVYRHPGDFAEARRGLRASGALRHVRTAPFQAAIASQRVTVQGLLPGQSPSLRPRASGAAGEVLAALHSDVVLPLHSMSPKRILGKSVVRAGFVAALLPELRGELDALLCELRDRTPVGLQRVTAHGNFHAGQLLAGPDGLALIDLDRLCIAAPAYDLASFAAHVAYGHADEMELVTATLDSLLAGYGSRPAGLAWFLATCLLRRAPVAFRYQDEQWPDAVASMVRSAREALR
ncbi:MAG: ATP-binding cassette, subfamily er 10 [Nocardioidaceae bacterium]|nr:ATP-binding cassette, subfamily er 10 [Nocardioidaceae bacterium]